MAQAYTSPDWSSGEGISASNLQSISNALEGIVQGSDRAIHHIEINGSNLVVTYVDGTTENFAAIGLKGIINITKTSSGGIDTYTIHYTDGTTYSFDVVNGASLEVIDNLESTSKTSALSANQGRVLDTKIYNKADKTSVTALSDLVVSAKSDISSLTTKTNKLSDDVSSLNDDVSGLNEDLTQLSESVMEISDKLGNPFVVLNSDKYTPFVLPKTKFTIRTVDGSTFKTATVKLYNSEKTALDYWSVGASYGNKRTMTNTYDGIVYVAKVQQTEPQDLIVEYVEDDSIFEKIDGLSDSIDEINNKIFSSEIISRDESYFDCAIPNGSKVTIKTYGGEPFESADFKIYNSAHVALDYWHLSSNYGNKRTITNTFDGVTYVAIANRNGNAQPIVISVGEDTSLEKRVIKLESKSFTVVDKSGNGDFTKISDAVANANNNDTIFIKAGVYDDEIIEAWGKTVHLIGESRNQVIVSNRTGAYATPPIEVGSGTIKNMTVIAYGNSSITGDTDYAIHVEDNNLYNKSLLIENCTLIGHKNSALGMGMRGGCDVQLINCDFIGKETSGLFMHDSANSTYKGIQNCLIDNCNIITEGTTQIMRIDRQNVPDSEVNYTFRRCFLRKTTDLSSTSCIFRDVASGDWKNSIDELPNCHLGILSFGNNKDNLNKTSL